MRFQFANTTRPSNLAKSLGRHLSGLGHGMRHADLLELVARMTGYADWHELTRNAGTVEPSADDDQSDPVIVAARRERQVGELRAIGLTALQAEETVAALHPTNCRPDLTVEWKPFLDGRFAVDAGRAYWVGPASPVDMTSARRPRVSFGFPGDEDRAFHMRHGKPLGDGFAFDEMLGPVGHDELDEAVAEVERRIRNARLQRRDERRLSRRKLPVEEARAIDAPWGTSTEYATLHALGVVEVSCDKHGGFRVPEEVLRTIPEVLRSWQDDEGYAWYEQDCQASLLMLGLPALFTGVELREARRVAEQYYPAIVAILDGRAPADPESVRRAKRGFTEERINWSVVGLGDPDADGMVRVEAVISDYWGQNPPSYEEMTTPRIFLVPSSDLAGRSPFEGGFEIDPDRHQLVEEPTPGMRH